MSWWHERTYTNNLAGALCCCVFVAEITIQLECHLLAQGLAGSLRREARGGGGRGGGAGTGAGEGAGSDQELQGGGLANGGARTVVETDNDEVNRAFGSTFEFGEADVYIG